MNGVHKANGNGNGNGHSIDIPELPHITSNIIPLSNVLQFYSQETFKQLNTMIENLSMTKDKENDVMRKKKFLNLIVSLRQDFVKIYTLVKWAAKSKEIGKLIDLLNWFRTQEFYFEQLSIGLNELNGFSGAKLPNSDLITSLEVLIKGRPQLPSYNLIPNPKISSEKILRVLQDLNLSLISRIALDDDIPLEFIENYSVRDGKIIFKLEKKYEVYITVGNDIIVDNLQDYLTSPFFVIDFKFLFGIDATGILKSGVPTSLPENFWFKLEKQSNSILLNSNLKGLYEFLNNFTKRFKCNLIYHQQLKQLNALKWKNLKYKYIENKIIIQYWNNPLNEITLFLNSNFEIEFLWSRNNEIQTHEISIDNDEFNVEYLLNAILNKHCELLIRNIASANPEILELINPYQISVKLTGSKSTVLSIDALTGLFYFMEPNSLQIQVLKKIGSFNNSGNESDLIVFINKSLVGMKLDTMANEIKSKLITIEWISNHIVSFKQDELAKLNISSATQLKLQFFKCKNWPSSWFLINLIHEDANKEFKVDWFVSRIKSIRGEWRFEWVSDLALTSHDQTNFEFYKSLADICSNKIINNVITQELVRKNINFIEIPTSNRGLLERFNIGREKKFNSYELMILIYNNGEFLPIGKSSNGILLRIELVNTKESKKIELNLKSKLQLDFKEFNKLNLEDIEITEHDDSKFIEIRQEVNLINNELNLSLNLLNELFKSLNNVNLLMHLMNELIDNDITILDIDKRIKIKVNNTFDQLYIKLPNKHEQYTYIQYSQDQSSEIKSVVNYVNKCMCSSKHYSFISIVNFMNKVTPVVNSIRELNKHLATNNHRKLANGLNKLTLDVKVVNLNNIQLLFGLNFLNPTSQKKIQKDKIVINVKFKNNKFNVAEKLELNISLLDNINLKNLKYKRLFELIFKTVNANDHVINLNYDFIVSSGLPKFFIDLGNCFLTYIEEEL